MVKQKIRPREPLVCICIINWNGGQTTIDCLDSLFKKTSYKNYKVILVDNGSTDGSLSKIGKRFPKIDIVESSINMGYTAGLNHAWTYVLSHYNPKYICNMNNDIVTVQKEWLSIMVSELEKGRLLGICGNKLLFPDGRLQRLYIERYAPEYNELDKGQYDFVKEVTAVGGANMLVKIDVINKIGATDENYFYGPDDVDYCYRTRKAGFKIVYTGFSKSVHIGSFSYLSSSKDFIYKHQSYGYLLFSFRWGTLAEKLKMPLKQLVRVFITRKDPFRRKSVSNSYFHKTFHKRLLYYFISLFSSLIKYKNVDNTHFIYEKA